MFAASFNQEDAGVCYLLPPQQETIFLDLAFAPSTSDQKQTLEIYFENYVYSGQYWMKLLFAQNNYGQK